MLLLLVYLTLVLRHTMHCLVFTFILQLKGPALLAVHGIRQCAACWSFLPHALFAELLDHGATGEGGGAAALAARGARRWLLRNAADATYVCADEDAPASACMSLISCLPALEHVELSLPGLPAGDTLNRLLEALALLPRLAVLRLRMMTEDDGDAFLPAVPAFAKLRSLRVLHLAMDAVEPCILEDVASALVSLTGLQDLRIEWFEPAIVPAALGQLEGLVYLDFTGLRACNLEAGCFDLPNLESLEFEHCEFEDADVLPSHTALQSLTRIEFSLGCEGHPFFAELLALPRLQHLGLATFEPCEGGARSPLARLPAGTGPLLHVDCSGHGLAHFPLILTQLVALECLEASRNEFPELPASITALSRLTRLSLGRLNSREDPLQLCEKRPLDVCALGDLSAFPALRSLLFNSCEVQMCESMLGAAQHPSITSLCFSCAHPAPESESVVLQLGQALRRLRPRSVLQVDPWQSSYSKELRDAQGQAPMQKFMAAMQAYGL